MTPMKYLGRERWAEGREERHPSVRSDAPHYGVIFTKVPGGHRRRRIPMTRQGVRDLDVLEPRVTSTLADASRRSVAAAVFCDHRFECYGETDVCERCGVVDDCDHLTPEEWDELRAARRAEAENRARARFARRSQQRAEAR